MTRAINCWGRQAGMALIASLILLLSLTLLALAAMQNTSLEERMAGNLRAEGIAFQAAEAALRSGEAWLDRQAALPAAVDTGTGDAVPDLWLAGDDKAGAGPYSLFGKNSGKTPWWAYWSQQNWLDRGDTFPTGLGGDLVFVDSTSEKLAGQDQLPRFVIEEDGYQRQTLVVGQQQDAGAQLNRFRITARGVDAGGRGEVLLQTKFLRRF
jgi:Tfp pilus assembly protein PilX